MKETRSDNEIMDYLDGNSSDGAEDIIEKAKALKRLISELKGLEIEPVDSKSDLRMAQFIKAQSVNATPNSSKVINLNKWWPYFAIAASVVLLFFLFTEKSNLFEEYQQINTNPDKLAFIYKLNKKQLDRSEINWLQSLLRKESNPNVRVAVLDLLSNQQAKLDEDFFNNLQQENVPSVQMAMLNIVEQSDRPDQIDALSQFSQREDLDQTVKSKAKKILMNRINY